MLLATMTDFTDAVGITLGALGLMIGATLLVLYRRSSPKFWAAISADGQTAEILKVLQNVEIGPIAVEIPGSAGLQTLQAFVTVNLRLLPRMKLNLSTPEKTFIANGDKQSPQFTDRVAHVLAVEMSGSRWKNDLFPRAIHRAEAETGGLETGPKPDLRLIVVNAMSALESRGFSVSRVGVEVNGEYIEVRRSGFKG